MQPTIALPTSHWQTGRLISLWRASLCLLNGCAVVAVADLAVTTVATVGKVAVKTTGAVISAAMPDHDDSGKQTPTTPPDTAQANNE